MLVASLDATAGSVIANAERISPASKRGSHSAFFSALAYWMMVSMLPVSGAEQLNTSEAHGMRPMISASGAYSMLLSPAPYSACGQNRFQRPCALAMGLSSSMMRVGVQRFPALVFSAMSCSKRCSFG